MRATATAEGCVRSREGIREVSRNQKLGRGGFLGFKLIEPYETVCDRVDGGTATTRVGKDRQGGAGCCGRRTGGPPKSIIMG